jgi:hypothetical protein
MLDLPNRPYRYLDSDADRQALIDDMHRIRLEMLKIAYQVPQDQRYVPRYHGWSLAAMLGHLQLMDKLLLWNVQAALIGVRVPISLSTLNRFNDFMARVYRARVLETTIKGIERNEKQLTEFVRRLPIDKFTKLVFDPALQVNLTVEQAVQEFFYFHWFDHLQTVRQVDGIYYEPPTASNIL